jgi:hypothetical protein
VAFAAVLMIRSTEDGKRHRKAPSQYARTVRFAKACPQV